MVNIKINISLLRSSCRKPTGYFAQANNHLLVSTYYYIGTITIPYRHVSKVVYSGVQGPDPHNTLVYIMCS